MNHQETMTDYLTAFIEGLKNSGVEQAVISPGSRSTPLALLLHREVKNQWSYFVPLEQQLQTIIQQFVKPILAMCL